MEVTEGKSKGGRQSKRRNERIRTFYKINNNLTTRSELSPEEIASYVEDIDKKCLAKFGVMKLSKYNLNVFCMIQNDLKVSLLQYAALRSANVCISLFYAGAEPAYDCDHGCVVIEDSRTILMKYPIHYIIWINHLLATARRELVSCGNCNEFKISMILPPCNHPICLSCFWKHLSTLRIDQDLNCPVCQCEIVNPNVKCGAKPPASTECPSEIALESLSLYNRLSTIPPKGHKNVKPIFEPLPLWRALQLYVGLTPKQRDTEMFKAVAANNAARIQALVHVGVNINCRNEYGQTPLFIAAWMGYTRVVDSLLQCGAATDIPDNAMIMPLHCAVANGHLDVASRLGDIVDIEKHSWQFTSPPTFNELIPSDSSHPGAGSGYYDNIFPEDFLIKLENLHKELPVAPKEKESCSGRSYFCDSLGWVIDGIQHACGRAVFPNMRFLFYTDVGGSLPPHVDLSRTDSHGITSTKTFIIYLTTCVSGGETNLLTSINADHSIIAGVKPTRGRLLIFPHLCPHEGAIVEHVPKLLLRGEMY